MEEEQEPDDLRQRRASDGPAQGRVRDVRPPELACHAQRVAMASIQYATFATAGEYCTSDFSGRGKSQSATPRIIIMTNPTRIAWVCALTS
jgi:hypothetical protein